LLGPAFRNVPRAVVQPALLSSLMAVTDGRSPRGAAGRRSLGAFHVVAAPNGLRDERMPALVPGAALSGDRGRMDVAKVAEAAAAPLRFRASSATSRGS
jgi:hypothetical protein